MLGDVMMHGRQLKAAFQPDGSYVLDGVFDELRPVIEDADIAGANLETTISGEDLEYSGGFTGIRGKIRFNSPDVLLDALKAIGIDVLQTANNHSLDRLEVGLHRTLDAVDARGFQHMGTYHSYTERWTHPQTTIELPGGPTVAYLAYARGTEELQDDMPQHLVAMFDRDDVGTIATDIATARAAGARLVVVAIHWGEEYQPAPEPEQRAWADAIVRAGADVIWGTHPHVVQPVEVRTVDDAQTGLPRDAVVAYSLGNVVSNQRTFPRAGGAMLRVTVASDPNGVAWIERVRLAPYWVDSTNAQGLPAYRILPITPERTPCHWPDTSEADCEQMDRFRDHAATILPASAFDWSTERIIDSSPPCPWTAPPG